MSTPTVSVVMSVYNEAEYLSQCIEGILSQEDVDFEFVIVDDGSTDASPAILTEYAERDHRIRLIRTENSGLTQALIAGCNVARGKYIARQDADDISLPQRLCSQAEVLDANSEVVFVSCFSDVIAPGGEVIIQHVRPLTSEEATKALIHDRIGPPGHGSVMFRSDAYRRVGGYRREFYFSQDSDLWYRLVEIGMLKYCGHTLYQYRVSPHSLSGTRGAIKAVYADFVHKCRAARACGHSEEPVLHECDKLRDRSSESSSQSEAATLYFIGRNLLRSNPAAASRYLTQCLRRSPYHWRALACLALVPLSYMRMHGFRQ